jgi:ribosome-binding factor A
MPRQKSRSAIQRQQRVGELVRHGLVDELASMDFQDGTVSGSSITVSEVRVSTDLKQARAYIFPLGGSDAEPLLKELNTVAPKFQGPLARRVGLRVTPRLYFVIDGTFDEADKINTLLARAKAKTPSK